MRGSESHHLTMIPLIFVISSLTFVIRQRHSSEGGRAAPVLRLIKKAHVFEHTAGPVPWLLTTQL